MTGINLVDICNAKFGMEGRRVVAFFETYELIDDWPVSRLIVLVDCQKTCVLFSCILSKNSTHNKIGLSVDKSFAIDNHFWLQLIPENLQFTVSNEKEHALFYYFSNSDDVEFEKLLAEVRAAERNSEDSDYYEDIDLTDKYVEEITIDPVLAEGSTLTKRKFTITTDFLRRKDEYSTYRPLNIYVATWNVNGQSPGDVKLDDLLNADLSGEVPDIYAIGLQEIDRTAMGITVNRTKPDQVWIQLIMDGLNPNVDYEPLESIRMVGMQLTIVVRKELVPQIRRFSMASAAIKGYRMKRNRGAVGISLQINDSSLCFVNAHFGTYWTEVQGLKAIHNKILRRMQFSVGTTHRRILEHEHVFWFGDLNYRIEEPFNLDQLSLEQEKKQVFVGFEEGDRTFEPTYRYLPGTDKWEFSKKCPLPAYTDRVLWKSKHTKQLSYSSIMAMRLSDHKPVFSLLTTQVRTCDERKSVLVYEEVVKAVDEKEDKKEKVYEEISSDLPNSCTDKNTLIDYGGELIEKEESFNRSELLKDIIRGQHLKREDSSTVERQFPNKSNIITPINGESSRNTESAEKHLKYDVCESKLNQTQKKDPKVALAETIKEVEQLLRTRSGY